MAIYNLGNIAGVYKKNSRLIYVNLIFKETILKRIEYVVII